MEIRFRPRVVAAPPGRPQRPGAAESQAEMRRLAEDPSRWSAESAHAVVDDYERLAPTWDVERGSYRSVPLDDALGRGGPFPGGTCLEIGAGTGLLTPLLRQVWPSVVSIDLSAAMLARSSAPWRVRADAAALPIASAGIAVVVLADAPLFAVELARVLRRDGVVVWSNALGDAAPYHVPPEALLRALARHSPEREWTAVTSAAGWGSWAVFAPSSNV